MYLVIKNNIVAPVESFTMLGLSTARGDKDKIGQFGSGAKHGVLVLLRNGITPIINLGGKSLRFSTVDCAMPDGSPSGKPYKKVQYQFDNGPIESTSITLDFGSIDWTDIMMGLREFVSNAIDSSDELPSVELAETITDGATVIGIPATPDVIRFYTELGQRFLQFSGQQSDNSIVHKITPDSKARVYRKGVFVRESHWPSLYDYNLGHTVKIDESRNMADSIVTEYISVCWRTANPDMLAGIFRQFEHIKDNIQEGVLCSYTLIPKNAQEKVNWLSAYKEVFGDRPIVTKDGEGLAQYAAKKGLQYTVVPQGWYRALECAGVKTLVKAMESQGVNSEGCVIKNPTTALVQRVMSICNKLDDYGLTMGRSLPNVKVFVTLMDAGGQKLGYYKNACIYIAEGHMDQQTILEELAHHITGSNDNSRDFQDYAFRVATAFMFKRKHEPSNEPSIMEPAL